MRSIRMLTAAVLAASGLVAVGLTTESAQAAGSKNLTVQYSKVIKDEVFSITGTLTTPVQRQVKLQYRYKSKGAWSTAKSTTSNSGGFFSFSTKTTKSRYYRFYAPASNGNAKITGNAKKVSVVKQSVTYYQIHNRTQCQFIGDSSSFDDFTVVAQFSPARPGRVVKLTTTKYGNFSGYQDGEGIEVFTVHPGNVRQSADFTVITTSANGAPAKYAGTKTTKLTDCKIIFIPLTKG